MKLGSCSLFLLATYHYHKSTSYNYLSSYHLPECTEVKDKQTVLSYPDPVLKYLSRSRRLYSFPVG